MFSSRVPGERHTNPLSQAVSRLRAEGRNLFDMTLSNPTVAGFRYADGLFGELCAQAAAEYRPEPLGLREAREAVAAEYARGGVCVPWQHVVLTSSTSEAYSFLFKLLCAPDGDAVLVPAPSYPLFEHLTTLDGVAAAPYRLDYGGRWWVDFGSVDRQWGRRTRAVLAVSPNNPTGSVLTPDEIDELQSRCAARGAALILDAVFADYVLDSDLGPAAAGADRGEAAALTFRLGGLSKSAGLPQVKLGWIAVEGPDALVSEALDRLELIGDTYLSVSTPVQIAAASLIAAGRAVRAQVQERIAANYHELRGLVRRHPAVDLLSVEAGWSAVLRIPARASEEEVVLQLAERDGVIVHPGFFFDFPHEAFLVISLLPEPECFHEGARRLLERVDA